MTKVDNYTQKGTETNVSIINFESKARLIHDR